MSRKKPISLDLNCYPFKYSNLNCFERFRVPLVAKLVTTLPAKASRGYQKRDGDNILISYLENTIFGFIANEDFWSPPPPLRLPPLSG